MTPSPVDFLLDDDAVLVPLERLVQLKRRGSHLLWQGEGRYCVVQREIRSHMTQGSDAAFYRPHYSREYRRLWLSLDVLSPTAFRVQIGAQPPDPHTTNPMIHDNYRRPVSVKVKRTGGGAEAGGGGHWSVHTGAMEIRVGAGSYGLQVFDAKGHRCAQLGGAQRSRFGQFDAIPTGLIYGAQATRAVESFALEPDEKILGMGERFSGPNRRGQTVLNWAQDGLGNNSPRCYKPIPFMLSSRGYGLFINTASRFLAYVGSQSDCESTLVIDDDVLDYYFFFGPRLTDVIGQYTRLTGRSPLPPRWSFGLWLGRDPWDSWPQVEREIRRFEREKLPLDVVNFNEIWMGIPDDDDKVLCNFKFDTKGFLSPPKLAAAMKRHRLRCCLWQLPYIGRQSSAWEDGQRAGALVTAISHGTPPREIGVIDFSSRRGVDWYKRQITRLLGGGADVVKVDFGETGPANVRFEKYDGKQMHNLLPLLYNRAAFEATQKAKGKGEALIWARPAYAGSQRYPVHWGGDPDATWPGLAGTLKGGLSLALCGFSFWSNDLGGYLAKPTPELYIRWTQMAMFCSHVRAHGNAPREPWYYGKRAVDNFRTYLRLRYSLMPYIYSEAAHASAAGLPMIRPLMLDHQDDPTVYHIDDQFLFGRDLLVAPVLSEGARTRNVYLPGGQWVDHWTGQVLTGPAWHQRPCPLTTMPIFIRAGALIPTEEPALRTSSPPIESVKFVLYPHGPQVRGHVDAVEFFDGSKKHRIPVRYQTKRIVVRPPKALSVQSLEVRGQTCGRAVELG